MRAKFGRGPSRKILTIDNPLNPPWGQCFMQRPVHPSYGRVKHNLDGCLFVCGRVWTGKKKKKKIFFLKFFVSRSPVRRTAQNALQSALHVILLSYYIGMCVFHER